jgi:hypothetical protein
MFAFISSRTPDKIEVHDLDININLNVITTNDSTNWLYHDKADNFIDKALVDSLGLERVIYDNTEYVVYKGNMMAVVDLKKVQENVYYNTGKRICGIVNGHFKIEDKEINTQKTTLKSIN